MEEENKMMNESQHSHILKMGLHEPSNKEQDPFLNVTNTKTDIDMVDKSNGFLGLLRRKKWMVIVVAVIQIVEKLQN